MLRTAAHDFLPNLRVTRKIFFLVGAGVPQQRCATLRWDPGLAEMEAGTCSFSLRMWRTVPKRQKHTVIFQIIPEQFFSYSRSPRHFWSFFYYSRTQNIWASGEFFFKIYSFILYANFAYNMLAYIMRNAAKKFRCGNKKEMCGNDQKKVREFQKNQRNPRKIRFRGFSFVHNFFYP